MKVYKRLFLLLNVSLWTLPAFSQPWMRYVKNAHPNFYEIKSGFGKYLEEEEKQKINNSAKNLEGGQEDEIFQKYKRWEWYWETRVSDAGEFPKPTHLWEEWENYVNTHGLNMAKTAFLSGDWKPMGPTDLPNRKYYEADGIGRLDCIAFHPTDANTFWVGSPNGGLWKTVDGGKNWSTNTDNLPILGISDIAIDYTNPDIMYIATGDREENNSIGVLKSTNGGLTWEKTSLKLLTLQPCIKRLLIHPSNPLILYVSSSVGIYKTIDGGQTWKRIASGAFVDLEFKPNNPSTLYVTSNGIVDIDGAQVFRTMDDGAHWLKLGVFSQMERIELAVSPANPDFIGALCSEPVSHGFGGVYAFNTNGNSFDLVYSPSAKNLLGWRPDGFDQGGQGWYTLSYIVSSTNVNNQYVGGVNNWKSTDGGKNWAMSNCWTSNAQGFPIIHADKHFLFVHPLSPETIFEGSDGGLCKTIDGGRKWQNLSNGLQNTLFFRMGASPGESNLILSGAQDNGTLLLSNSKWSIAVGGDGAECIVDFLDTNICYASITKGVLIRSTSKFDNQGNESYISNNIPDNASGNGAWLTPFIMDYLEPSILYVGYEKVYKTINKGDNWFPISQALSPTHDLKSLAVATSNPLIIYAATDKNIFRSEQNRGHSWRDITSNLPLADASITSIVVHPDFSDILWVSLGGYSKTNKVFRSDNGGSTWKNISGTLPNISANCVIYQKDNKDGLYLGTDVGVFYTDSTFNDWTLFNSGLPNVMVNDLEIQYGSKKIRAATYGRGIWESKLYNFAKQDTAPPVKPVVTIANGFNINPKPSNALIELTISNFQGQDLLTIYNYLGQKTQEIEVAGSPKIIDISTFPSGIYYAMLKSETIKHIEKFVKIGIGN